MTGRSPHLLRGSRPSARFAWLAATGLTVLLAGPISADEDAVEETSTEETTAEETSAVNRDAALVAGSDAGGAPVRMQFGLVSQREVGVRGAPNVGIVLPPLGPVYDPATPDYYETTRETGPQHRVKITFATTAEDGSQDEAKSEEFRDLKDGLAVGVDAQRRGARTWLRLTGRHLGLEDQDARLELRAYGDIKVNATYSQIPHHYVWNAPTLFDGVGSGQLSIPETDRAFLQGSTDDVDAASRARTLLANANRVDLHHRRDRTGVSVDWTTFDPLAVQVNYKHERRKGTRPWSASFGLSNVVELPWPVDYDTEDVEVALEYAVPSFYLRGAYRVSEFDNDASSLLFDNPWRVDDSSRGRALIDTYGSGAATGLIDLYPSNRQEDVTLTAIKRQLPGNTTLQAMATWSTLDQDDPLLPFTTNTAVVPGAAGRPPFDASDPANRPAETADARFENRTIHLQATSRPTDKVNLKLFYRDHEMDNRSAQIFTNGFVPEDTFWRTFGADVTLTNLPIGYAQTDAGLEVGYRLAERTKLTFGYTRRDTDRRFREVESNEEDRFKLSLDTKPAPWVDLRASYLSEQRDAREYDFAQFFTNQGFDDPRALPFLRKFDQADRDRDRLQIIATFYPDENVSIGAMVIVGHDDFPDSPFGVLENDHQVWSLDASWAAGSRATFYGAVSLERYEMAMRGREWFPNAVSDPFRNETGFDSASNWTADSEDEIETATVGLQFVLIPDRLRFELAYSRSESDGEVRLASPVGTAADDLSPFPITDLQNVDDVRWTSFHPELELEISEKLRLKLAWLSERFEIDDFTLDGLTLVPVTDTGALNGGILMGTIFDDYNVDLWYLQLEVKL